MPDIGIYARVSTTDQDPQRQLDELQEFAKSTYDEPEIHTYADIISGTETERGEEYQRLRVDIEDGGPRRRRCPRTLTSFSTRRRRNPRLPRILSQPRNGYPRFRSRTRNQP